MFHAGPKWRDCLRSVSHAAQDSDRVCVAARLYPPTPRDVQAQTLLGPPVEVCERFEDVRYLVDRSFGDHGAEQVRGQNGSPVDRRPGLDSFSSIAATGTDPPACATRFVTVVNDVVRIYTHHEPDYITSNVGPLLTGGAARQTGPSPDRPLDPVTVALGVGR